MRCHVGEIDKKETRESKTVVRDENQMSSDVVGAFKDTLVRKKAATMMGAKAFKRGLKKENQKIAD